MQQVVGAAAIYNHLLSKHGGVGTRPKSAGSNGAGKKTETPTGDDVSADADAAAAKPVKIVSCDCGGAMGSCKVCT